jgi:hypothetical protein
MVAANTFSAKSLSICPLHADIHHYDSDQLTLIQAQKRRPGGSTVIAATFTLKYGYGQSIA